MKTLIVILIAFCFLGLNTIPVEEKETVVSLPLPKAVRPTMGQRVELMKSKLEVQNSKVGVGIAELKYNY